MAQTEYEKTTYSTLERILYLFVIPVVFTSILTIVLLSVFNYNVMDTMLRIGNQIPLIEKIVPDPEEPPVEQATDSPQSREELAHKLAETEDRLADELEEKEGLIQQITELQDEIERLQDQLQDKTQTDEEYAQKIKQLADVYAKMTPSKAAPILENLTLHERVLVLNEMKPADQTRILEKMKPELAAEASILLKDQILAQDLQIAALQERLALHHEETGSHLSYSELALTFANMNPESAATILIELINVNEKQAIEIMKAMNVQTRSAILSQIANRSEKQAAELLTKLTQS